MTKRKTAEERVNTTRKREARETYGAGSCSPVMVAKTDKQGNAVIGKDGKPKKAQQRDKQGKLVWLVCVSLGTETYTDKSGHIRKRQRKVQKRVHGTLEDARSVAKQLTEDYADIDYQSAGMTFADACASWATSMRNANTCSAAKLKDYETMMAQVSDKLGNAALTEIKKLDVESALAAVNAERKHSQRRQRERFQTVKRIFEYCIDNGWLVRNPCRGIDTPRVTEEVDRRSLTSKECARLRACLDRDELAAYENFDAKEQRQAEWGNTFTRSKLVGLSHISGLVAVRLMLATGMRRGETLGLTWEHVDFENQQITVMQSLNAQMVLKSPKTKKSVRTIAVDADTMAHLRKWKDFQKRALHLVMVEDANGKKRPVEQTPKTPVCCNCKGQLMQPRNFARWWGDTEQKGYRDTIGFPDLVPHELRHTQATMLLGNNVDVKTVQTRLGHASSSLTLDIYGHALPANDRAAADIMAHINGAPAEPSARVVKVERKTA